MFVCRLGCATVCTVSEDKSPHGTEINQSISSQLKSYWQKPLYFLLDTAILGVLTGLDQRPVVKTWEYTKRDKMAAEDPARRRRQVIE